MQVMPAFKAKHDIFSMQQARPLGASSVPGLNMVVLVHAWFALFTPHSSVLVSQHVASSHEAASVEHLVAAAAPTLVFQTFLFGVARRGGARRL